MPATTPFTDPATIRGDLYASSHRIANRTAALHRAKETGEDAAAAIVELAKNAAPDAEVVMDLGCGRGTTTVRLAEAFVAARILAVDQSPALLEATRRRAEQAGGTVAPIAADFHRLPIANVTVDLVVAAFCLYHSPQPRRPIAEVARCLRPGGVLVAVTKSIDSYREIDELVERSGLDPGASARPSLYRTFHSANAGAALGEAGLTVAEQVDRVHRFRFTGLDHLAEYLITSPKHSLEAGRFESAARLADLLRTRLEDEPITTTSTVTYLVARSA